MAEHGATVRVERAVLFSRILREKAQSLQGHVVRDSDASYDASYLVPRLLQRLRAATGVEVIFMRPPPPNCKKP
jgi:hypothetical protein